MNRDKKITKQELLSRLEKAVQNEPQNAELQSLLGRALLATHRYEEAVEAFRKAIVLGCREETCYTELSLVTRMTGDEREADRVLKDGWKAIPESLALPFMLYAVYASRAQFNRAVSVMERAIAVHPEEYKLHHAMIRALVRDKRVLAAADYLESIGCDFADRKEYIYDRADLLLSTGFPQKALDLLKEKQSYCNPEGKMYLTLLSRCYRALADEKNAEETMMNLYSLFPDKQTAIGIAALCMMRGDFAQAKEYLKDVEDLQDRSIEYFGARFLAAACQYFEEKEEGEQMLRRFIEEIENSMKEAPRQFIQMQYAAECYRLLGEPTKAEVCEAYVRKMSDELMGKVDAL